MSLEACPTCGHAIATSSRRCRRCLPECGGEGHQAGGLSVVTLMVMLGCLFVVVHSLQAAVGTGEPNVRAVHFRGVGWSEGSRDVATR
jgi:hypothetical protein